MAPPKDDDITYVREQLDDRGQKILTHMLQWMDHESQKLAALNHRLFGSSSERMPSTEREVRRALTKDEVERLAQAEAEKAGRSEPDEADRKKAKRKHARKQGEKARQKNRSNRLKNLPRIEQTCTINEADLPEGMTLADFVEVGSTTVERIEHVREHLVINRYILQTLKHREQPDLFIKADAPPTPVKGGIYGASVYAQVAVLRFIANMPLRRISDLWSRQGHPVAPSVVGGMFHQSAALLKPIHELLMEEVRNAPYVFADETHQPYLSPGKGKVARGWMWMALCDTAIVYRFDESRSANAALALLGVREGHLHVDGYSAYNAVANGPRGGCWAHARRDFCPLRETWPEAQQILSWIHDMYLSEAQAKLDGNKESLEQRRSRRERVVAPIARKIIALAETMKDTFTPSGPHHAAVNYIVNFKEELLLSVLDPNLPLDNNVSERALRCIAIARRTSLFVGPGDNGMSYAIMLSIVKTCEVHGVDPHAYLTDVLPRLRLLDEQLRPAGDATAEEDRARHFEQWRPQLEALCPARWQAGQAISSSG
jgi:transposase